MTFAKSQGQTRDKVFAVFTGAAGLSAENALVAASRHKEDLKLFVVGHEERSIRRAASMATEKKEALDQSLMSSLSQSEREDYLARRDELRALKQQADAEATEIERRETELRAVPSATRRSAEFAASYVALLKKTNEKARAFVERLLPPKADASLSAHAELLSRAFSSESVRNGAARGIVSRSDVRTLTEAAAAERDWLCVDEARAYCLNKQGRIEAWDRELLEHRAPGVARVAESKGELSELANAAAALSSAELAALDKANVHRGELVDKGVERNPDFGLDCFRVVLRDDDGRERKIWSASSAGASALERALDGVDRGEFVELDGNATERKGNVFARAWSARVIVRDPAAVPRRTKESARESVLAALASRPELRAEILRGLKAEDAFASERSVVGLNEKTMEGKEETLTTRDLLADDEGRARLAGVVVARDGDRVFIAASRLETERVVALSPSDLGEQAAAVLATAEVGAPVRLLENEEGKLETDRPEQWAAEVESRRRIAAAPEKAARKLLDFGEGALDGVGFYAERKGLRLDASRGAKTDGAAPLLDLGDDLALCATPDGRAVFVESADLARRAREANAANPFELFDMARDAKRHVEAARAEREARPEAWNLALDSRAARAFGVDERVSWSVLGEARGRDGEDWKLLRARDGRTLALRSRELSDAGLRVKRGASVRLGFSERGGLDASRCSTDRAAGLVR